MQEIISKINKELRNHGSAAVQEIKVGGIPPRYGYRPQYVFDAVNNHLGAENWKYEVLSKELFDHQAVVEVKLMLRFNDADWFVKGSQVGQMTVVKGNVGDAYKGAITDALQKCFSLLSIGSDAYKGDLKTVFHSGQKPQKNVLFRKPTENSPKTVCPKENTQNQNSLPKIPGIEYQQRGRNIFALGKSYERKDFLKAAGFHWDNREKAWCMAA